MKLTELLRDSLQLIRKKPRVFLPKLLTTVLYTICILALMRITLDMNELAAGLVFVERSAIFQLLGYALLTLAFLLAVYFIDLFTYAMYPSIVNDYQNRREINLERAFREALGSWLILLILGAVISVMAVIVTIPLAISLTLVWENPYLVLPLIFLTLAITLAFAMIVFFVIPVAVIEKRGFMKTLKNSFSLSLKHRWSVLRINLIFLFLTSITLALGLFSEFQGPEGYLAIFLFIVIRLIQSAIYTYISVVNPYFYVKVR